MKHENTKNTKTRKHENVKTRIGSFVKPYFLFCRSFDRTSLFPSFGTAVMAKTKHVAGVKKQLVAKVTAKAKASAPPVEPPKRVRGKQQPVEDVPPPVGPPECDISWANFEIIQKHYGLSEMDTTSVLLSVVGPDTEGSKFRDQYRARVNKEYTESGLAKRAKFDAKLEKYKKPEVPKEPEPALSPPEKKQLFCPEPADNQLGDPSLYPEDDIPTEDDHEGEEEEGDHVMDPELNDADLGDDEGVEVPATGGGGSDDQDSPQAGAAAVNEDTQEYEMEPTEAVEPVRERFPKDDPARDARDELERSLKAKPTPARQGRKVVHARRVEGAPDRNGAGEYKPLLFLQVLLQQCFVSIFLLNFGPDDSYSFFVSWLIPALCW